MMFIPVLLIFLAIFCAVIGYRKEIDMFKNLAMIFVIAAIGSTIVVLFALSAL